MIRKRLLIIFLLFTTILVTACNQNLKSYDEYKIGVIAPQFGPYEALGLSIIHGAEIAVKDFNETHSIDGKKIELIKVDDGGLAGEGTWKAKSLVTEMVLGVIGHLNSDISISASEIYSKAMIPQISPGSTSPLFTERNEVQGYVFRTIGRDDAQGKLAADFITMMGYKKIAILHNNRSYGKSVTEEFKKKFNGEIAFSEMYEVDCKNFNNEINLLKKDSPDFLFFIGEYSDASRLIKDIKANGIKLTFLGSDGVFDNEFINKSFGSAENSYVISYPPIQNSDFINRYKNLFNKEIGGYSAASYDATKILLNAILVSKIKTPENVAKNIRETKNFNGLTSTITFNEKGDVINQPFSIYKVENGVFKAI